MTIRHVVSWKLATTDADARAEQSAEISRLLHSLTGIIPEILSLEVGINILAAGDNFDVVLVAEYDDEAALERYARHPEHQKVAAYIKSVVAARSAVDYRVARLL